MTSIEIIAQSGKLGVRPYSQAVTRFAYGLNKIFLERRDGPAVVNLCKTLMQTMIGGEESVS